MQQQQQLPRSQVFRIESDCNLFHSMRYFRCLGQCNWGPQDSANGTHHLQKDNQNGAQAHFVWWLNPVVERTRKRRRSKRARPYICLFSSFRRVICPSTCP